MVPTENASLFTYILILVFGTFHGRVKKIDRKEFHMALLSNPEKIVKKFSFLIILIVSWLEII